MNEVVAHGVHVFDDSVSKRLDEIEVKLVFKSVGSEESGFVVWNDVWENTAAGVTDERWDELG
ncbi:MAG: hypothetical protein ACKVGW_01685 [Verrucomicrobiia bacterium]